MEIRSENAAKPMVQFSAAVVDWILSRPCVNRALDYGCGKLRYTPYLARRCRHLGLVDSAVQLHRSQLIAGNTTTIENYARRRWPSCRVYIVDEFWRGRPERYDLVLCANVLSAIPSRQLRTRSLRAIRSCLHQEGLCLVVNQHTNSYFRKACHRPQAIEHLDGWILKGSKGSTYYGLLNREKTIRILRSIGFRVVDAWVNGQSAFVLVRGG